ncbi:MAG: caspase family protein [Armatimonadetes bacterium]|nr:caspase family protein [Armatimonadota bacterium]
MLRRLITLITVLTTLAVVRTAYAQSDVSFFAPNRWAIVIGASDYPDLGSLPYAASDAEAFSRALVEDYKFPVGNVRTLTDKRERAEEKPTVEQINKTLDQVLANPALSKGDLLVFYFSGHGLGVKGTDLLLPTDAKFESAEKDGLAVKSVIDRIVKSGIKNVVFVMDACRSGQKNPFGTELVRLGIDTNIAVILGCEPGGRSYELPQFGQGALTYMLVQAMKDENLVDPLSGAQWISTIADAAKKSVETLTAREQGQDDRQVPAVWCQKNQDILMGAFGGKGSLKPEIIKFMESQRESLDADVYSQRLFQLAVQAAEEGKSNMAIGFLRTIRQLDKSWGASLALEATQLDNVGQVEEAEQVYKLMVTKFPDQYHSLLYKSLNTSDPEARIVNSKAFWEKAKTVDAGMAYFLSYFRNPAKTDQDKAKVAQEIAKGFEQETGPWAFFSAFSLTFLLDPDVVYNEFELVEIDDVRIEYVQLLGYLIAERTKDPAKIMTMLEQCQQTEVSRTNWQVIERNYVFSNLSQEKRFALAPHFLANDGTGERLWTATRCWGDRAGEHFEEIKAAAEKYPFSLRAQQSVLFATLMKDLPDKWKISDELDALGMYLVDYRAEFYAAISQAVLESTSGIVDIAASGWNQSMLVDLLRINKPASGQWRNAVVYAAYSIGRDDVLAFVAEREIKRGKPSVDMIEIWLSHCANNAKWDEVVKFMKDLQSDMPLVALDFKKEVFCALLVHGRTELANQVKSIVGVESSNWQNIANAYQHIVKGENSQARESLSKVENPIYGQVMVQFLCEYLLGDHDKETLKEVISNGHANYKWAHAALVAQLAKVAEPEDIDWLLGAIISQSNGAYDVPLPKRYAYDKKGEVKLNGNAFYGDDPMKPISFDITWDAGKATVKVTVDGKTTTFSGTINSSGVLDVKGDFLGKPSTLRMRMAPLDWWKEHPQDGPLFRFLREDGMWADGFASIK